MLVPADPVAPAPAGSLKPALTRIAAGGVLSETEAEAAFSLVMDGQATPAQIAALAMGLRVRGESVSELVGAARAMRSRMLRVRPVPGAMDVCGTGGDGHATLNVSTAVAFVLAALGVPVAKHGNRAVSSRAGATDTLEALGVPLEGDPVRLHERLGTIGLAFLAAPSHHPAMRHAGPVRAELGIRTVFNLLGPLCNPAGVTRQMIGVFDPQWQEPLALALRALGVSDAWVVHGDAAGTGGLDELGLAGENRVVTLRGGRIGRFGFTADQLGLPMRPVSAIAGGDALHNAAALERLLRGETGAYRDVVLLNASAALQVAGWRDGGPSGDARSGDTPPSDTPPGDAPRGDAQAGHARPGDASATDASPGCVVRGDALQPGASVCMSPSAPPLDGLRAGITAASRVLDDGSSLAVLQALRGGRAPG